MYSRDTGRGNSREGRTSNQLQVGRRPLGVGALLRDAPPREPRRPRLQHRVQRRDRQRRRQPVQVEPRAARPERRAPGQLPVPARLSPPDGVGARRSCPVSTGGGTRRVQLVREGRGGGWGKGGACRLLQQDALPFSRGARRPSAALQAGQGPEPGPGAGPRRVRFVRAGVGTSGTSPERRASWKSATASASEFPADATCAGEKSRPPLEPSAVAARAGKMRRSRGRARARPRSGAGAGAGRAPRWRS